VTTEGEARQLHLRVRELPLPPLLATLLESGGWQHPGDDALRHVMPWFEDPLDFLLSAERMGRESRSLDMYADDGRLSRLFHVTRGSVVGQIWLPWLDAERAFFIAVNRNAGDDVGIALDFRSDAATAAVVASDAWTYPGGGYLWRPVAPSFEAFAHILGLTQPGPKG
jgi:hypothetical protein